MPTSFTSPPSTRPTVHFAYGVARPSFDGLAAPSTFRQVRITTAPPRSWAAFGGHADQYVEFARDCSQIEIAPADVAALYRHDRLTDELVARLNPDADLRSLAADIDESGYPQSGG
jgi:hypothetical protein